MRIDVISIFPDYLAPLNLSLVGKAKDSGLLDIAVHDLRDWTDDPHRTVDDTPAGGGAGMVMKADVWGKALDDVLGATNTSGHTEPGRTVLAIPTPSGTPLTQRIVEDLATVDHLVIACGRYEGIDSRVAEHYATHVETLEYSIGDYVLNGGEVAALVLVEAVGRLQDGVIGNPESLVEESHGSAGLLEYPVFTRPTSWRGSEIPPELLSGNHALIARWRRDRAIERTARRRPDMLEALTTEQLDPTDRSVLARLGYAITDEGLRRLTIRPATESDIAALVDLAAETFPMACPPGLPAEAIEEFIATNLSAERFAQYLSGEQYLILVAQLEGSDELAGYTLIIFPTSAGEPPYAADVARVVPERPAAELSKIYVREIFHRSGVSAALMEASINAVADARIDGQPYSVLWLGTNGRNKRAHKFYTRSGFVKRGARHFTVGGREQDDVVFARPCVEDDADPVAH